MSNEPFIDEHGVLHDPAALAMIKVVERENCRLALCTDHVERVRYFADRIAKLGRSPQDAVIVVIGVDDPIGRPLADVLMPGHDWASIRYARGLADRPGIQELLDKVDLDEGNKLRTIDDAAVVMVDRGVVFVCAASEVLP